MGRNNSSFMFLVFGFILSAMFNAPVFIVVGFAAMMLSRNMQKNKQRDQHRGQQGRTDRRYKQRTDRDHSRQQAPTPQPRRQPTRRRQSPKSNPYKTSGIKKFKDYDYDGAAEDFEKALQIDNRDISVHFNLACCYSLNENKEKSLYHLDQAVSYGFKDFEKIKTHDALAYLRIQEAFEVFEQNNYRLTGNQAKSIKNEGQNTELLEQLQKLAELREKGLLTEEEFVLQKKKLLG